MLFLEDLVEEIRNAVTELERLREYVDQWVSISGVRKGDRQPFIDRLDKTGKRLTDLDMLFRQWIHALKSEIGVREDPEE